MLIYFRCRRCKNALSVAMRQAGCPMICPLCKGEIVVPSASEITPPAATVAAAVRSSPPVADAPGSPPKELARSAKDSTPISIKQPRQRVIRRALVAGSIGLLVLVALGWTANRVWSKWWQPASQDVAFVDESLSEDADNSEGQPDLSPPLAQLASGLREEEEIPKGELPQAEAPPAKVPDAKSDSRPAGAANLVVKRRNELSEDELRKQLLWAPEVGLKPADVPPVVAAFQSNLDPERLQMSLEPTYLLAQRPDLKALPMHRGLANRLDRDATRELHFLGRELHLLLDRLAAKNGESRPSAVLLGEFIKAEVLRDKKPAWLRPEAVPTLQQILGHEDSPVRLLLVDLLSRIDGRAASIALVQHAVFDLSPEVRDAAIKGLDRRPREEYRSALVEALRYPWSPAADHAAEALVALNDRDSVPLLVKLLKEPDPSAPVAKKDRFLKREMVRLNHLDNCLTCHPPALTGSDPVAGIVPGFTLAKDQCGTRNAVPINSPPSSVSKRQDYANAVSIDPLMMRADITYLRQDFSIQQPVHAQLGAQSFNLRFDYLLRFRPLTEKQTHEWKTQVNRPDSYEQREAVLFALRELTGQDAGPTTEAWEKLYPTSEFASWANELTAFLVNAPDLQKPGLIKQMRERKGVAYTEALAQAIPQLAEKYQDKARAALVERMKRMSRATLRNKLGDHNREVRSAALSAIGWKEETALIPDVSALLADPEPAVAEAAEAALKALRTREAGPEGAAE